jgi:hypothetical protein
MMIKRIFPVIVILMMLNGCRNQKNRDQVESNDITGFDQMEEVKEVYYRFPSPDEMLNFIDREKLAFDDEIILPIDNSKGYLDSKSQALNLGVYIADLAYITLFQRQKESLMYFQVIYGLSDKIRISSALDPNMLIRYENNIQNIDTLKALADEALTDITNYLVKNDKEKVFALISIGGFVESLYLAFQLCGDFSEDNIIVQRISDQKLVLENLINYSLEFAGDQSVSDAINLMHPIRSVYNELVASNTDTKVAKDKDGKLIITGGEKIIISKQQFTKLKEATFTIRKQITQNLEN